MTFGIRKRRSNRIALPLVLGLAILISSASVSAGGMPSGNTTMPLLAARGTNLACNQGDWVHCPIVEGGLASNRYHAHFVEVPTGTGNLTLQIFDPDVGAGGGAENTAGRDTGVATAAQAVQYSVRNPAGTVQTVRFDRGNGVAVVGATTTGIALSTAAGVSCTTAGTTTADNSWCTIITVTNPAAGHWELRMASVDGTPIHYYGVRAVDTSTARDLNIYTRSYLHYGNQNVNAGRVYNGVNAFYPYVTEGCQLRAADFDSDSEATETIRYRSRTGLVDQTFTQASVGLSGNDNWNEELLAFTTNSAAREYGIWLNEVNAGVNTSNHVTPWIGSELAAASPPTTQPQGGADRGAPATSGESFRFYLPNNNGAAPTKPFVEQRLSLVTGSASPPASNVLSNYRVTLSAVNPTPYPINFAQATGDLVTSFVPADVAQPGPDRNYAYVGGSFATNCGAVVAEPANNAANVSVQWNPGTIPANTSCTAEYRVNLTPGSLDTAGTVLPMTATGTAGTLAQFLDETNTRFIFGPMCALQLTVGAAVAVPVTLSSFSATAIGNDAVEVRWGTDSEAGTLGFDLYSGSNPESLHKLNSSMVPARGVFSLEATSYSTRLANYDGAPLWLEEIAADGKRTRYGPFQTGKSFGSAELRRAIPWAPTRQAIALERSRSVLGAPADEVVLRVRNDGAQRLRYEDLAALGLNWNGLDANVLALSSDGVGQALAIDGGAVWGPGSALRFLGHGRANSLYTRDRIYRLRLDPAQALRMGRSIAATVPSPAIESFQRMVSVAPNTAWSFGAPTVDPWYAFALTRLGADQPTASLDISAPDRIAGTEALLQLSLWGGLSYEEPLDHRVRIDLNGQPLLDDRFDGITARLIDQVLDSAQLQDGSNTVRFTLDDTGLPTDRVHVEGIALSYQSQLLAEQNRISHGSSATDRSGGDGIFGDGIGDDAVECRQNADCRGYRVDRFNSSDILVYRQRAGRADQLGASISASALGHAVLYGADEQPGDLYVLATRAAHHLPAIERARAPTDLFATAASYIAIAPAFMLPSLETLLAHHRASGLSARAVAVEDIYTQFGDGSADPEALRRFVRAAYNELGTRYLLIAGGDTYDYQNYTGANSVSLVPTFYRPTHPLVRYGATDVPFGDIDDDDRLDLAIGRMPARTTGELERLISKSILLEEFTAAQPALLVADQAGNDTDFAAVSDSFELSADPAYRAARPTPERVFLAVGGDIAVARNELFADINAGTQWVSFYGHGSPIGWTFSGLLHANDIGNGLMSNQSAPFLSTMWGCWGGFFVDPYYQGLSHALLVGSDAGAAAVIAASGLTESRHDEQFAALLVPAMSSPGQRLGDAFMNAQRAYVIENPQARDVWMGMLLLGDPALRLMPSP